MRFGTRVRVNLMQRCFQIMVVDYVDNTPSFPMEMEKWSDHERSF